MTRCDAAGCYFYYLVAFVLPVARDRKKTHLGDTDKPEDGPQPGFSVGDGLSITQTGPQRFCGDNCREKGGIVLDTLRVVAVE